MDVAAFEEAAETARREPAAYRAALDLYAGELVISEHTVNHHITNILKKLGLHSREQVTSRLHDQ